MELAPGGGLALTGASAPALGDDGRGAILLWLSESFEGIRNELRLLTESVDRQQSALSTLVELREAELEILQLASSLPERIGAAIGAALDASDHGNAGAVREVVDLLTSDTASSIADPTSLHDAGTRLVGRLPDLTGEVQVATARVDARIEAIVSGLQELVHDEAEPEAPEQPDSVVEPSPLPAPPSLPAPPTLAGHLLDHLDHLARQAADADPRDEEEGTEPSAEEPWPGAPPLADSAMELPSRRAGGVRRFGRWLVGRDRRG